ncbi:hypothetical protein KIW84_030595 [Lathyrus oleraceus]|uniref:RING-type E3 ubiquitin transferase n=1 Tax=Pisum sativum TaxID=3888 RepID=A0A9D4XNI7_PEA|nr:hypothetical protein KIW84_030595 [Pisum sativum]
MKVKRNSGKANYTSKHAPLFCEIWFIYKGRHIWTREASEKPCSLSSGTQPEIAATESLRFRSSQNGKNELPHAEYLQPNSARTTVCSRIRSLNLGEIIETEATNSSKSSRGSSYCSPQNSVGVYQDAYLEGMEERITSQLIETEREVEAATDESFAELLNRGRKEAEDALRVTVTEQQKLLEESENISGELQMTMRNVALLNSRAKEATHRRYGAAHGLLLIQTSISTLWRERQQIRRQKMEALRWLEWWKSRG